MSRLTILSVAIATLACTASEAMMGGRPCTSGEWATVGKVSGWHPDSGTYINYGTGTVISDRWMISAAHVTGNNVPTGFQLEGQSRIYGIRNVRLSNPGTQDGNSDIRLVEFPPGTFSTWSPIADSTLDLQFLTCISVGYGQLGTEVPDPFGWLPTPNSAFTQKYVGGNVFKTQAAPYHFPYTMTADFDPIAFDSYDSLEDGGAVDLECQFMSGDSGGPSFVYQSGQWKLVGIHWSRLPSPYFVGTNFGFGAQSVDWNISWFLDQIEDYL